MTTAFRFSLAEYDRMISQGVLEDRNGQRIELIQGEIREMSPPGPLHENVVDLLDRWSHESVDANEIRVRVQNSIGIPGTDSAPQPDIAWVRQQDYSGVRPQPADVLLLIEVSDSSVAFDRGEKADLYAGAGIAEYWIVNLPDRCIEVYRDPSSSGYREKRTYSPGQTVSPLAQPAAELEVAALIS